MHYTCPLSPLNLSNEPAPIRSLLIKLFKKPKNFGQIFVMTYHESKGLAVCIEDQHVKSSNMTLYCPKIIEVNPMY